MPFAHCFLPLIWHFQFPFMIDVNWCLLWKTRHTLPGSHLLCHAQSPCTWLTHTGISLDKAFGERRMRRGPSPQTHLGDVPVFCAPAVLSAFLFIYFFMASTMSLFIHSLDYLFIHWVSIKSLPSLCLAFREALGIRWPIVRFAEEEILIHRSYKACIIPAWTMAMEELMEVWGFTVGVWPGQGGQRKQPEDVIIAVWRGAGREEKPPGWRWQNAHKPSGRRVMRMWRCERTHTAKRIAEGDAVWLLTIRWQFIAWHWCSLGSHLKDLSKGWKWSD